MSEWYSKIESDVGAIIDCLDHFESELKDARKEVALVGRIEKNSYELPGIVEHRFGQLQEVEAILEYLNIEYRKLRASVHKKWLTEYDHSLSSRDAERYVDTDSDVYDYALLVNRFALLRNKYLGIHKGLEAKSFQINNIVKLRSAGIEDSEVGIIQRKSE